MADFIAYLCNDHNLTSVLFDQLQIEEHPRELPSSIGWIQDGRSLLKERPKPTQAVELTRVFGDIPSRSIIGYVSEDAANLQPMRFRRWIFAHDGEFSELGETRSDIVEDVPNFIRDSIGTATGSAIVFQQFLAALHGEDALEISLPEPRLCAEAMLHAMSNSILRAAVANFAAVAVSERTLIASSFNQPMYFQLVKGLEEPKETLFAGHHPKSIPHPNFKAIVVTNIEPPDLTLWTKMEEQTTLYVDRDWELQTVRGF